MPNIYTYYEKEELVEEINQLVAATGRLTATDATYELVGTRSGVAKNLLQRWYKQDKAKIRKAIANGWGHKTRISDQLVEINNNRTNPRKIVVELLLFLIFFIAIYYIVT